MCAAVRTLVGYVDKVGGVAIRLQLLPLLVGQKHGTGAAMMAAEQFGLLDVSNGFEEIAEWGGEQVDNGDVGCGVSVSSSTGPCGLEDAVQAFEAGVGVG